MAGRMDMEDVSELESPVRDIVGDCWEESKELKAHQRPFIWKLQALMFIKALNFSLTKRVLITLLTLFPENEFSTNFIINHFSTCRKALR